MLEDNIINNIGPTSVNHQYLCRVGYQPTHGPLGCVLRLISGLVIVLITDLILPSQLVSFKKHNDMPWMEKCVYVCILDMFLSLISFTRYCRFLSLLMVFNIHSLTSLIYQEW